MTSSLPPTVSPDFLSTVSPAPAPGPWRLNIVGAGRVGCTLAALWAAHPAAGLQLQCLAWRSPASRQRAAALLPGGAAQHAGVLQPLPDASALSQLPPADVWLLAVPDGQIAPLAQALAALPLAGQPGPAGRAPVAWHASGFLPSSVLAPLAQRGWAVASAHPGLSFADPAQSMAQFAGTVCALEGDAPALARVRPAFEALGGRCFVLAAADKPLYHGAAVWASNFLPVLAASAQQLWAESGVPAELLPVLTARFVRLAADNLLALGPAAALTGPAARGDTAVLQAQGAAMAARDPALGQAYAALSTLAGRLARTGHVLPAMSTSDPHPG